LQLPSRFHPLEGFLEMDFVVASLSAQNPPTVPLSVLVIDARRKRQNESPLHFSLTASKFSAREKVRAGV
jgi:hypothetical protein